MLRLHLDPQSPVPLYVQIAEQIRNLVARGVLRPGEKIPTVRVLAVQCRVNRNTAARAVQSLESEGVLRTRVGKGTFVSEGPQGAGVVVRDAVLAQAIDRLIRDARSLGVGPEELRRRLEQRLKNAEGGGGKGAAT